MSKKNRLFPVVPSCSRNKFRRSSQLFPYIGGNNFGNNSLLNSDLSTGTTSSNQTATPIIGTNDPQQPELFPKPVRQRKAKERARREQVQALIDFYKDRRPRAGAWVLPGGQSKRVVK